MWASACQARPPRFASPGCRRVRRRTTWSRSRSRSRSASTASRVAVTMRTPGTTRSSRSASRRRGARAARRGAPRRSRGEHGRAATPALGPERLKRSFYTSSSCGVCGKGALEAVRCTRRASSRDLRVGGRPRRAPGAAARGAGRLRARPAGCTPPGLFDADGELVCVREDVGRHNALDKVVGWAFGAGPPPAARRDPLRQRAALVRARAEGRARGLPGPGRRRRALEPRGRAGRGAGITLCGWARADRVSVYAHAERVV